MADQSTRRTVGVLDRPVEEASSPKVCQLGPDEEECGNPAVFVTISTCTQDHPETLDACQVCVDEIVADDGEMVCVIGPEHHHGWLVAVMPR